MLRDGSSSCRPQSWAMSCEGPGTGLRDGVWGLAFWVDSCVSRIAPPGLLRQPITSRPGLQTTIRIWAICSRPGGEFGLWAGSDCATPVNLGMSTDRWVRGCRGGGSPSDLAEQRVTTDSRRLRVFRRFGRAHSVDSIEITAEEDDRDSVVVLWITARISTIGLPSSPLPRGQQHRAAAAAAAA